MKGRTIKAWVIALLLIFSATAIWTAFRYDKPIREALVKAQGKGWKKSADYKFYGAVRDYGDWPELMLASGLALLIAWRMRNREWVSIVAAAMIASTVAGILANGSRLTTGRTRPRESPKMEQGFYGPWYNGKLTIGNSAMNSFPSGHTATAFGLAWVILLARPWIGIGVMVLACLIGWASITMGAHHPSDVTVSIILSFVVAWFTWQWMQKHGANTWRMVRDKARKRLRRKPRASTLPD